MTTALKRFLGSRGVRKFRRNKLAVFSLVVIALYALIATVEVAMDFDGSALEATKGRVGPNFSDGFISSPTREDRANNVKWFVRDLYSTSRVNQLKIVDAATARGLLDEGVNLYERKVVDLPPAEVAALMEEADDLYDKLVEDLDWRDELHEEKFGIESDIKAAAEAGDNPKLEKLQNELIGVNESLVERESSIDTRLDELEAKILEIQPMPTGWAGIKYTFRTFLGTDSSGASIACKGFYSIKIAFMIGFVVSVASVIIGTLLGASAAFFGGWVDYVVLWVISTLSSIPSLVLLMVIVYAFFGHPYFDNAAKHPGLALIPVYAAFIATFWISTARVIRGEVMKIKELEYVQAATAIGFSRFYILIRHVLPNTLHLMFINFSLLFIGAIKSEVILSFLGVGVKGQPSWGIMISQAKEDVSRFFFWQIGTATALMFILVLAFNILSDALQDAFDPKHTG